MRQLLLFFRKHYIYFLFGLLETLSLILLFRYNDYQNSAMYRFSGNLSGSIYNTYSNVTGYFALRKKNRILSDEISYLHSRLPAAFYKTDTNTFFYKDTLYKLQFRYISAKVINNTTILRNNFLMIDKGKIHGVENHMGVIIGNRLVGQVVSVSKHFSWVMSMLNKDSRVSGKFKKNNQLVNVEWYGGNARIGQVKEIPKHVRVVPGDTIITSGNSDIFPEGILIGTIRDFDELPEDNFNAATLLFSTDFNSLGYVEVVVDLLRAEKDSLRASFKTN